MQKRQLSVHIKRHLGQKVLDSRNQEKISYQSFLWQNHVCQQCGKAFVEAAGAKNCKHGGKSVGSEGAVGVY